jgi:hypothetical protein
MATWKLSGGDALKKYLSELGKKVEQSAYVEVGYAEDALYPDGTPVASIAFIHEYGAIIPWYNAAKGCEEIQEIPPRPTFRPMIAEQSPTWGPKLLGQLKTTDYDIDVSLQNLGDDIVRHLVDAIQTLTEPPLKPVTLMIRKMLSEDPSLRSLSRESLVNVARHRLDAGESTDGISDKPLIDTKVMEKAPKAIVFQGLPE